MIESSCMNFVPSDETRREFDAWLASEREKGLVDVKFAVQATMTGNSSTRKAMEEFLRAEKMINAGIIEPHLVEAIAF
jgi:hypothetical protein